MISSTLVVHECRRSELRSCATNVEQLSDLPEDILVGEILVRLPVKSLIRFKVVCKFWYDLIRSPNFMSLHDSISKKKTVSFYLDSYSRSSRGCNLTTTDITLGFFDATVPLVKLTLPLGVDNVRIMGCCNGIVCLSLAYGHHTFSLWNPATKQSRLISLLHPRGSHKIYAGFFFDSVVADSFKLVRVIFSNPQKPVSGILDIFTLNDNKWRIKELPVHCRIRGGWWDMSPVTCLETCMYWIVTAPYLHRGKCILCLDVVDEVFKHIIELPSVDHLDFGTWLLNYKGSLAMFVWEFFYFVSPCECFDMWVFNDDCGGNWHKQLTLRPSMPEVERPLGFISKEGNDLVLLSPFLGQLSRLWDEGNDRVLLSPFLGQLSLLWDPDSGKTTKLINGNGWVDPFFLYSESFASV